MTVHRQWSYRGEGANHAIVDISILLEHIKPLVQSSEDADFHAAIEKYEIEMIERSGLGVLASRQACMDAHDFTRLNDKSPLVRRRLMRADLEDL